MLLLLAPLAALAAYRLLDRPEPTTALELTTSSSTAAPTSTFVSFEAPSGDRATGARCWMVVIDESASMSTADATGARADAVRATAEFLSAYGLDDDRIGVTWFADRPDADVPREAAALSVAPTAPAGIGSGTRIASALSAAVTAMDQGCGNAQRVVVLVSDGQAGSRADLDGVAETIGGAGDQLAVHLIAMNGDGAFDLVRQDWQDPAMSIASIKEISSFGGDDVAAAVATILSIETGQQITPR